MCRPRVRSRRTGGHSHASSWRELNRLAVTTGFTHLTQRTNCPGTLPDIAATYIRVGARTIHVHGDCVVSYKKLWTALQHAAQVRF